MNDADTRKAQADKLLELTQTMVDLAREQAWEDFEHRQQERDALSRALFADDMPEAAAEFVAERVSQVLAMDPELMARVQQARDEAGHAMRELKQAQQGAAAYQRFSR
ncbi:hypothetical protein CAI21_11810 [Alkalilimnicola ehrlichii]|uniref:Flagellar protein FliT n=1 Tax=Alkalilimnicola ehrlichii TaxID=351052 RepID=A0A3E0WRV7_9GAMM|nr:flagellar protein FliT [Alkalilimnicola ehrlichii]RFA28546.1 hypothetical protein CAI21_11810 [Alkalilimnicola ehrlichii]RFA35710.1 hypothetical protein CAL65_12330 [Alkalilimnicola ehrlichii]